MNTVTISKEEYFRLKRIEMMMDRLDAGGVDNWEWYGESLNPEGELDIEEMTEKIKKDIGL